MWGTQRALAKITESPTPSVTLPTTHDAYKPSAHLKGGGVSGASRAPLEQLYSRREEHTVMELLRASSSSRPGQLGRSANDSITVQRGRANGTVVVMMYGTSTRI